MEEARIVITGELRRYRGLTYQTLQRLLDQPECFEVAGASGTLYQIEVAGVPVTRRRRY